MKMDADLKAVLNEDGITKVDTHSSINQILFRLPEIKARMGDAPWSVRIVYNEYISAVLIAQPFGHGNRWHYHDDCDEFWIVLEGALKWIIEGRDDVIGQKGDIVHVPRHTKHKMVTVSQEPSVRLSISLPDVKHFFVEEGPKPG